MIIIENGKVTVLITRTWKYFEVLTTIYGHHVIIIVQVLFICTGKLWKSPQNPTCIDERIIDEYGFSLFPDPRAIHLYLFTGMVYPFFVIHMVIRCLVIVACINVQTNILRGRSAFFSGGSHGFAKRAFTPFPIHNTGFRFLLKQMFRVSLKRLRDPWEISEYAWNATVKCIILR